MFREDINQPKLPLQETKSITQKKWKFKIEREKLDVIFTLPDYDEFF